MSEGTRMILTGVSAVVGLGWFLGVEVWRGRTQDHSPKVFWLHLTAPLVAIVFLLVAIVLLINSERIQRARARNGLYRPESVRRALVALRVGTSVYPVRAGNSEHIRSR